MKTPLFTTSLGQGPDLVLLHGWGTHSVVWQRIAAQLSQHYRLTLIDLPGFGHSLLSDESYDINTVSQEILEVAPECAIWMGWSLGGLIAMYIAARFPHRISKLISVASSPKFLKDQEWPGIDTALLETFAQRLKDDYENTLLRFLTLQLWGTDINRSLIKQLQQDILQPGYPHTLALFGGLNILKTADLRSEIKSITCPVLYLLGSLDTIVPSHVEPLIRKINPMFKTTVIPKASHALFISHETDFLSHVETFLS